jgi:hypothetical protein
MRSVRHGVADIEAIADEAGFIIGACWPEIMKLGTHLQFQNELTFYLQNAFILT